MPPLLYVIYYYRSPRKLFVQTVAPLLAHHSSPKLVPIRPHHATLSVKSLSQSSTLRTLSSPAGTVQSDLQPRSRTCRSLRPARSHSPAAGLGRTCSATTEHLCT